MGNKINIYFDKTLGFYVENYVLSDFYDDDIRLDEAFDAFGPMVFAAMVVEDKATHDLGGSSQLTPSLVAFPDGALSRSIGNMSALDRGNDAINFDYLNLDYLYNYSLYDLSGVSDYVGDMDVSYIYADDLSNVDWNYGYSYASSYGVEPSYAAYLNNDSFESGADFGGLGVNFYSQGVSVGFTFQFPIVLDLNGDGISITQRDTSTVWRDVNGDGTAHRTSWAAAGDGVLVYDCTGTGDVDAPEAYQFTLWDPTADSDMEALANVFDTNGNGALDAGDAQWSSFKVLVTNADGTTTLKTLAALGITAIDLEPDNTMAVLPDGTQVLGSTTFTRANGTTGTAADVVLTADADGYLVQSTTTANGDGTTSIRVKAYDTDGSFVKETLTTTSADGHTRVRHSRAPSSTSVRMRKSSVNWPDTKSSDQRAAEAERGLKRLYEAIEAGDRPEHPALKERVVALRALRDQAQVDFERAQASLESSGSMALTPAVLPKFATTARRRLRQEGGGHRRDHLRAFAPRVEVGERHVRVITSQAELLRALTSASRGKSAYPETV